MLLTSAGIRNDVLKSALAGLIGKPFGRIRVVFIPTASVATAGDHGWLVQDLNRLHGLGWREFNVLELNGLLATAEAVARTAQVGLFGGVARAGGGLVVGVGRLRGAASPAQQGSPHGVVDVIAV